MPKETPPSSSRKNPDSASTRTWNGMSGRPAGRIAALSGAPIAHNPAAASASATRAPAGNSTPVITCGARMNASPMPPSAIHATASVTAASTGWNDEKSIGGQRSVCSSRAARMHG